MKKINNWENVKENTSIERIPAGGYICGIKRVTDVPEKEYLKIEFDICRGEYKNFFQKQYDADTREDKKWPNAATTYRSYKDSAASMFRGFTNAIEKSNKNYHWDFDEKTLVNKIMGVILGDEEYMNQSGKVRVRTHVVAVRSTDTIENNQFTVPELKKLEQTVQTTPKEVFNNPFADDNEPKQEVNGASPFDDSSENPFL